MCVIAAIFGLHDFAPHAIAASTPGRLLTHSMLSELPEPESQINSAVSRRSSQQEHPACAIKGQAEYYDAAVSYADPSRLSSYSHLVHTGCRLVDPISHMEDVKQSQTSMQLIS